MSGKLYSILRLRHLFPDMTQEETYVPQSPEYNEMLDTLSLEMKEELVEYLKADIAAAKAAPKKSYLEEQWAEIMRLINVLDYEPYIDDQIEIEEIWNICEVMIKSGKLESEPLMPLFSLRYFHCFY